MSGFDLTGLICLAGGISWLPDVAPLKYKLFNKEQMKALGATRHEDMSENQRAVIEYYGKIIG